MSECLTCGYLNDRGLAYCQSCGTELPRKTAIEVRSSISDDYERTTLLTIVLVLQYLSVALFALVGMLIFILGVFLSTEIGPGTDLITIIIISLIPLAIAGLLFWLTYALQDYNDSARKITIALAILNLVGLLLNLSVASIVGILLELIVLYALILDVDTVRLFQ